MENILQQIGDTIFVLVVSVAADDGIQGILLAHIMLWNGKNANDLLVETMVCSPVEDWPGWTSSPFLLGATAQIATHSMCAPRGDQIPTVDL